MMVPVVGISVTAMGMRIVVAMRVAVRTIFVAGAVQLDIDLSADWVNDWDKVTACWLRRVRWMVMVTMVTIRAHQPLFASGDVSHHSASLVLVLFLRTDKLFITSGKIGDHSA